LSRPSLRTRALSLRSNSSPSHVKPSPAIAYAPLPGAYTTRLLTIGRFNLLGRASRPGLGTDVRYVALYTISGAMYKVAVKRGNMKARASPLSLVVLSCGTTRTTYLLFSLRSLPFLRGTGCESGPRARYRIRLDQIHTLSSGTSWISHSVSRSGKG
jgi:hypothetical protein